MCHDSSHGFGYGLKISHFPLSTAKPPSTAHCHGTLPTPAAAAATEWMLLRRSIPSQGAAAPRPASMCCRQHLEDGRDYETTIWVPRCISVAATELLQLWRSRCCDGATQQHLRRAHSARRVREMRRAEWRDQHAVSPTSIWNSKGRGPRSHGPISYYATPLPRNISWGTTCNLVWSSSLVHLWFNISSVGGQQPVPTLQAYLLKKYLYSYFYLYLATFFFNVTDVFCTKRRVGHAGICPTMVTSRPVLKLYPPRSPKSWLFRGQKKKTPWVKLLCSKISPNLRRCGGPGSAKILSLRSRLSRTTSHPSRLFRTRSTDCHKLTEQPVKTSRFWRYFRFFFILEKRQKLFFIGYPIYY